MRFVTHLCVSCAFSYIQALAHLCTWWMAYFCNMLHTYGLERDAVCYINRNIYNSYILLFTLNKKVHVAHVCMRSSSNIYVMNPYFFFVHLSSFVKAFLCSINFVQVFTSRHFEHNNNNNKSFLNGRSFPKRPYRTIRSDRVDQVDQVGLLWFRSLVRRHQSTAAKTVNALI